MTTGFSHNYGYDGLRDINSGEDLASADETTGSAASFSMNARSAAKRWISANVVFCFDEKEGLRQIDNTHFEVDRRFYRWILDFSHYGHNRFLVTAIFNETGHISYPIRLIEDEFGFHTIALYDEDGRDLLKTKAATEGRPGRTD